MLKLKRLQNIGCSKSPGVSSVALISCLSTYLVLARGTWSLGLGTWSSRTCKSALIFHPLSTTTKTFHLMLSLFSMCSCPKGLLNLASTHLFIIGLRFSTPNVLMKPPLAVCTLGMTEVIFPFNAFLPSEANQPTLHRTTF